MVFKVTEENQHVIAVDKNRAAEDVTGDIIYQGMENSRDIKPNGKTRYSKWSSWMLKAVFHSLPSQILTRRSGKRIEDVWFNSLSLSGRDWLNR